MYLTSQRNWMDGDKLELAQRQAKEEHIVECLLSFLKGRDGNSCQVDTFMEAYADLPQNKAGILQRRLVVVCGVACL